MDKMLYCYIHNIGEFLSIDLDGKISNFDGIPYFKYPEIIDDTNICFRSGIWNVVIHATDDRLDIVESSTLQFYKNYSCCLMNDPTDKYKILFFDSIFYDRMVVVNFRHGIIKKMMINHSPQRRELMLNPTSRRFGGIMLHHETYLPLYKPYSKVACNIFRFRNYKIKYNQNPEELIVNNHIRSIPFGAWLKKLVYRQNVFLCYTSVNDFCVHINVYDKKMIFMYKYNLNMKCRRDRKFIYIDDEDHEKLKYDNRCEDIDYYSFDFSMRMPKFIELFL